jgi:hypothetical protein
VRTASGTVTAATQATTPIAATHEASAVSNASTTPPSSTIVSASPSGPIPGRPGRRQFAYVGGPAFAGCRPAYRARGAALVVLLFVLVMTQRACFLVSP